jgi:hypothetical protein
MMVKMNVFMYIDTETSNQDLMNAAIATKKCPAPKIATSAKANAVAKHTRASKIKPIRFDAIH